MTAGDGSNGVQIMARFEAIATAVLLLLIASSAFAQQATERYIPLGQSPGLSARQTYVGVIAEADPGARTVTFGTGTAHRSVRITPKTWIWIDRSKFGLPSMAGSFDDLKSGRRAEVKYVDESRREAADWIKVVPESVN